MLGKNRARGLRLATLGAVCVIAVGASLAPPQAAPVTKPASATSEMAGGQFVASQGRVLDTRAGSSVGGYNTAMPAHTWRSVQVSGKAGVPTAGVSAVVVNLTTVAPSAAGYINASPGGEEPSRETSYHNYIASVTESNSVVLKLGADGTVQLRASTSTHLVVDVEGYYTTGPTTPGGFAPVAPTRLVDTRTGAGMPKSKLADGSTSTVQVTGLAGVPSGATAVAVNISVANQTNAGYFSTFPANSSGSLTRTYFRSGYAESFGATIQLSATGSPRGAFKFALAGSSVDLTVDILGYFAPGNAAGGFTPDASRAIDTRLGAGKAIPAGATRVLQMAGVGGVPALGATAVQAQVTVVDPSASGYLKMWADERSEPGTSVLNYRGGTATSNSTVSALNAAGAVQIKNYGSSAVNIVVDMHGWYAGPILEEDACRFDVAERAAGVRVTSDSDTALLPQVNADQAMPVYEGEIDGSDVQVILWRGTPADEMDAMLEEQKAGNDELEQASLDNATTGVDEQESEVTEMPSAPLDESTLETIAYRTQSEGMVEHGAVESDATVSTSSATSEEGGCVRSPEASTTDVVVKDDSGSLSITEGGETGQVATSRRTYPLSTSVVRYRTFIPAATVRSGCGTFVGDNRDFDSHYDRRNRTRASIFFNWPQQDMDFSKRVGETKSLDSYGNIRDRKTASDKGIKFVNPFMAPTFGRVLLNHSVGNPLCPATASITYNVIVEAWTSKEYPIRSARITGTRLKVPYHEAYLYATSGTRGHTMLRKTGNFLCLIGNCGNEEIRAGYPQ